jgi:hypothetical protein
MVRIGRAPSSFIARTDSTGSCATSCVFAHSASRNVVENTTFDKPARASVPGLAGGGEA